MDSIEQARQTQLQNIQTRTGKTLEELYDTIRKSGLTKHGQIREYLKKELHMGYGDANSLTAFYLKANNVSAPGSLKDTVDTIYSGSKAGLRPLHDKLMLAISDIGQFEISPKKTYISLRCKKQFAMVGPGSISRIDVGINNKDLLASLRLTRMPEGSMCPYRVSITKESDIDEELLNWITSSYKNAL